MKLIRSIIAVAGVAFISTATGQLPCSVLDVNGDGFISPQDLLPALTQCIIAGGDECDYDGDADTDAADYAFFIANIDRCIANSAGDTRTTLPIRTSEDRLVAVDISDQVDLDAGYREIEIRFQLPSSDAEVIAVTASTFSCDAPECFVDPQNSNSVALGASQVTALGVTGDTYITIGDRTGDASPAFIHATIDNALFSAGQSITAGLLGWSLFPLGTVDTPSSPGIGSAAGNINNTVVLVGVAQTAQVLNAAFDVAYTLDDQLFINTAMITTARCHADTNGDGELTAGDFNAWVLAFNSQSPACDQNGDGNCTPDDFNAWVLKFNAGCP